MINTLITSAVGKKIGAEVTEGHAVKVATVEYDDYSPTVKFFVNETYGIEMNKNWSNAGAGNSNEIIHNGIDSAEWTGSAIAGAWDFTSTNNPDTGTKNIEIVSALLNDTAQFARGSNITMDAHTGFAGRIYISSTGHNLAELTFNAWDTISGTIVGSSVNIFSYVNTLLLGVWQTFTIPLTDMGLAGVTFDALRIEISVKAGATFDLDNIILTDPTGSAAIGTTTFTLSPDRGTELQIESFIINIADVYSGTVPDGTMPNIPYNGFFGLPKLDAGIIFRVWVKRYAAAGGDISFIAQITQLMDFMSFGEAELKGYGSDGTNSWVTINIKLAETITLKDLESDKITWTMSEDFSGLLFFRASCNCRYKEVF